MCIEKLISEFEILACKVFAEGDFNKKNKIEIKIELLVDKVYNCGLEQLFYDRLFNSANPLSRIEIAYVSNNRNFDLHRALDVLEKIKRDAHMLIFFEDAKKNKKWQDYFSSMSNVELKEKIAFYDKIKDDFIFRKYYDCIFLYGQYYESYILSKQSDVKKAKEEIVLLLEKIRDKGKLSQFFVILFKKAEGSKSLLNLILTNYFSWVMAQDSNVAINNLEFILQKRANELNPKMLMLVKNLINEMLL